ncbi:MAG TPA: GNAT family N-acetyltransferase, partial [Thermoanaerobaculia bacterium]|nr:GNAT family N-acetyltransferase [Thermoanaerobaculia bacterium]
MSKITEPPFTLATAADEDLLLELMQEFYIIEHLPYDEQVACRALKELWSHTHLGRIYLIHSEGKAAGYLVITFGFSLEFHGRDAMVDELYLREAFRGRGLGRESLELVEAVCRQ